MAARGTSRSGCSSPHADTLLPAQPRGAWKPAGKNLTGSVFDYARRPRMRSRHTGHPDAPTVGIHGRSRRAEGSGVALARGGGFAELRTAARHPPAQLAAVPAGAQARSGDGHVARHHRQSPRRGRSLSQQGGSDRGRVVPAALGPTAGAWARDFLGRMRRCQTVTARCCRGRGAGLAIPTRIRERSRESMERLRQYEGNRNLIGRRMGPSPPSRGWPTRTFPPNARSA